MVDFIPSVDNPVLFNNSIKGDGWHVESMFNIIGDAGFIPHFAHQSLVKYGDKDGKTDRDGGTAYTWRNPFLNGKDHMQFELLGLDDKGIGDAFKAMRNLVVDDLTDDCRTLICPSRFMDDIYRIWCCSRTVKSRFGDYPYDMYFENEYKDYVKLCGRWRTILEVCSQLNFLLTQKGMRLTPRSTWRPLTITTFQCYGRRLARL